MTSPPAIAATLLNGRHEGLLRAHFGALLDDLHPSITSDAAPNGTEGRVLLLTRWSQFTDLLDDGSNLDTLSDTELASWIGSYLMWRISEIEADHPLLSAPTPGGYGLTVAEINAIRRARNRDRLGWRASPRPLKQSSLTSEIRSLQWYVRSQGRNLAEFRSAWQIASPRQDVDRSIILGDAEIAAIVTALITEKVRPGISHAGRRTAWHARQLSAFLVLLWGSCRIGDLSSLRDTGIVAVGDRLDVTIPRTKTSATRRFSLHSMSHAGCPVAAIRRWLHIAGECGYDRGGRLLPLVNERARDSSPINLTTATGTERTYFQHAATAAGVTLDGPLPEWDAVRTKCTPHGLRALLANRALDSGATLATVKHLGGWQSEATFWQHYASKAPSIDSARQLADILNQGAHG